MNTFFKVLALLIRFTPTAIIIDLSKLNLVRRLGRELRT
jgi:hypothetical protein